MRLRRGLATIAALLALAAAPAAAQRCPLDCDDDGAVAVDELLAGVALSLERPDARACDAADVDRDGAVTIDELLAAVAAALARCPLERVPCTARLDADGALLLTPATAMRGDATYAVVLTERVRDAAGRPLQADAAFAALRGAAETHSGGPVARFSAALDDPGNPYPDGRLVSGPQVTIPDHFALRGLDDTPALIQARAVVRRTADAVGAAGLFSTTAPVRLPLAGPIDLDSVRDDTVLFFRRPDGRLDVATLLAELTERGEAAAQIALAIIFPTATIEGDLLAVRDRLDLRGEALRASFIDPDPSDDLPIGVFTGSAAAYADFLAANPDVALVARGLFPSPDFRAADGLFDAAALRGLATPDDAQLDFILTLPRTPPPHPVVIVQHGFGGGNGFVLTLAGELARNGLAAIAIDAVSHGRRGSPLDLLRGTPLQVRDIFRQTVVDQMALARVIRHGVDLDGDGASDLDGDEILYLGVSLGGIVGATFIAVEPSVATAVLNVAGGRVAFLGNNPGTRPIFAGELAAQAGLSMQDPAFEAYLQRMFEVGQQALDPADPLNFAGHWTRDPLPGVAPRRVLIQEGIGDILVNNDSTEALATAGGLTADVARSDPDGVSGLWRFEPPGGHGIISRADVREQAVAFLVSRGTAIVDTEVCADEVSCRVDELR